MAKKRILTWHKPSRSWKKQINHKVYYFGHGRSENDTKAYRQAERRYLELMDNLEATTPVVIQITKATILHIAEKYLQHLEARHQADEITAFVVGRTRSALERFMDFMGRDKPFCQIRELDLEDYRNHVIARPPSKITGKPIAKRTAKDRLAEVKRFVCWAHDMRILHDMPRNLRRYSRIDCGEVEPKRFSLDEIRQLWKHASDRLRCFMVLALNTGMGQQDISDLRIGEFNLGNGIIDRKRSKTGIRTRHQLWPITVDLIGSEMVLDAEPDDLAFRSMSGEPLVWSKWEDGRLKRSDSIKCMLWRVMEDLGIDGGRGFYTLRKTSASEIERINPGVTEMFLGHAERGMKRHYAERNWDALDAALVELEKVYGLDVSG